MRSPFAERERKRLIAALLPDVAFDGWTRHALRTAARRADIPVGEAIALFPRGAADLIAAFSRWADYQMLERLEAGPVPGSLSRRVALALRLRFEVLAPWREAAGFHARVVQHECDHLDGILYPQRMTDHRLLVFVDELQRHPIDLAAFLAGETGP